MTPPPTPPMSQTTMTPQPLRRHKNDATASGL